MTMGLSLVVEDSQKRWMSAITSWCVKSCPRNASGKRILHFSNRFGSASEQVEVDLAFQLSRSLTEIGGDFRDEPVHVALQFV